MSQACSIPDVTFVVGNLITFEEPAIFLLKGHLFMVFLLTSNVVDDCVRFGLTHREGAIASLPIEASEVRTFAFNPFRRAGLYRFNDLRQRRYSRETKEQMNVVLNPTHLESRT